MTQYRRRPSPVTAWRVDLSQHLPDWVVEADLDGAIDISHGCAHFASPDGHGHAAPGEWLVRDETGAYRAMADAVFSLIYEKA